MASGARKPVQKRYCAHLHFTVIWISYQQYCCWHPSRLGIGQLHETGYGVRQWRQPAVRLLWRWVFNAWYWLETRPVSQKQSWARIWIWIRFLLCRIRFFWYRVELKREAPQKSYIKTSFLIPAHIIFHLMTNAWIHNFFKLTFHSSAWIRYIKLLYSDIAWKYLTDVH